MTSALSVAQARDALLAAMTPLSESERVPLLASLNRVLAEDVCASFNVPAHDNSAMDGYAVRCVDLAVTSPELTVTGTAFAGKPCRTCWNFAAA